jgi:hypothetical protein
MVLVVLFYNAGRGFLERRRGDMSKTGSTVQLFSYGTLQKTSVQVATFGRALKGRTDALPGFIIRKVPVPSPIRHLSRGMRHNLNAVRSTDPNDAVEGMVLEVTAAELAAADGYEAPARYHRMKARLRSGGEAWVYVHRPKI